MSNWDRAEYAGKTPQNLDAIHYEKTIGDTYYLIEEVRTRRKMLVPKTFFKRKAQRQMHKPPL